MRNTLSRCTLLTKIKQITKLETRLIIFNFALNCINSIAVKEISVKLSYYYVYQLIKYWEWISKRGISKIKREQQRWIISNIKWNPKQISRGGQICENYLKESFKNRTRWQLCNISSFEYSKCSRFTVANVSNANESLLKKPSITRTAQIEEHFKNRIRNSGVFRISSRIQKQFRKESQVSRKLDKDEAREWVESEKSDRPGRKATFRPFSVSKFRGGRCELPSIARKPDVYRASASKMGLGAARRRLRDVPSRANVRFFPRGKLRLEFDTCAIASRVYRSYKLRTNDSINFRCEASSAQIPGCL